MSKRPVLNLIVVGAGLIGERHARLIDGFEGFKLAALVDPSPNAHSLAEELSAPLFPDLAGYFEQNSKCDGMIIATPNETHRAFASLAIAHAIPCLIEKPLAANSKDAEFIAVESESANIPVLVGHHRRHHSVSRALKAYLDSGRLGKLVGAQLTWMLRKPDDYFKTGDWRTRKGGGPVWINLIHEVDLLRYFLGEIAQVSAMLANTVRGHDVEDAGAISLRFENGAIASAILSDSTPSPWHFEGGSGENPNIAATGEDGLRLFGTSGTVSFPSMIEWKHDSEDGHWGTSIHSDATFTHETMNGEAALTAQLNNFADVIHNAANPLVTARDGLQSVRVIEAIHQAAESGSTVTVLKD